MRSCCYRSGTVRRLAARRAVQTADEHRGVDGGVERRVAQLQIETAAERHELTRTLERMRKQKLLDVLPNFSKGAIAKAGGGGGAAAGGAASAGAQPSDVTLGFGEALKEAVGPVLHKVESVEGALKDVQRKVAASPTWRRVGAEEEGIGGASSRARARSTCRRRTASVCTPSVRHRPSCRRPSRRIVSRRP